MSGHHPAFGDAARRRPVPATPVVTIWSMPASRPASGSIAPRPLPDAIGTIPVPHDDVSRATWEWAQRSLPRYLLPHSVRAYCWGAAIAGRHDWVFDRQVL